MQLKYCKALFQGSAVFCNALTLGRLRSHVKREINRNLLFWGKVKKEERERERERESAAATTSPQTKNPWGP